MDNVEYGMSYYRENGEVVNLKFTIEEAKSIKSAIEEFMDKLESNGIKI